MAEEAVGVVLDRDAAEARKRRDDDLVCGLVLMRLELSLERGPVLGFQDVRGVDDAARSGAGRQGCGWADAQDATGDRERNAEPEDEPDRARKPRRDGVGAAVALHRGDRPPRKRAC